MTAYEFKSATEASDSPPKKKQRFHAIAIDDIILRDEPAYQVDGIIPQGPCVVVVVGKDKSGKTFGINDLFFHVAMGRPYLGRPVQQGTVVYVSPESVRGVERRLIALRRHYGVEGKGVPFYFVPEMVNLMDRRDVDSLIKYLKSTIEGPISALIIDPLIRAMPGKNDSNTDEMGVASENAHHIADILGCVVAIAQHTPRSDETRSRGSNVLDGNAAAMISVVKADGISTMLIYRMKDGPDGLTWKFRLERFELGEDRNGRMLTTCVCAAIGTPAYEDESAAKRSRKLSDEYSRFLEIIQEAVLDAGEIVKGHPRIPSETKAISRDMLKKYCVANGWTEADAKQNAIRAKLSKALNKLAARKLIGLSADYVWLAQPAQPSAAK